MGFCEQHVLNLQTFIYVASFPTDLVLGANRWEFMIKVPILNSQT